VFPKVDGFWDDLKCLVWHQDEPVGGTSVYAQWCVMRAARRAGIPVLLDGQGGDETLCGYRKFYVFYLWHLLKSGRPKAIGEGFRWLANADRKNWNWAAAKRYVPFLNGGSRSLLNRVCNPELVRDGGDALAVEIGPGTDLRQRQKDDLLRFSVPALLHYEDRNSMAHSVEARVPLLDHRLAEFAVNCPVELKLRDGWTKWILRQTMRGILPEAVRLRKSKLGFATPEKDWLRQDLRGTIREVIAAPKLKSGRILRTESVRTEFDSFLTGKQGSLTEREAFRILNLELWARMFAIT